MNLVAPRQRCVPERFGQGPHTDHSPGRQDFILKIFVGTIYF